MPVCFEVDPGAKQQLSQPAKCRSKDCNNELRCLKHTRSVKPKDPHGVRVHLVFDGW